MSNIKVDKEYRRKYREANGDHINQLKRESSQK